MRIRKNINSSDAKFSKITKRIIWQTANRITNEILGVKGLITENNEFHKGLNMEVRLLISKPP